MAYRVLIIDDSPVMRVMVGEMLKALGHEVVGEADNGQGGLDSYKQLKPDLVTLDISLPDQDGISVLTKLRRIDLHAKVVIITGNDQKTLADKAMALKALGVLVKPFEESELGAMLERVEGRARPGGGA
ncbi:response regulator [Elusimicrobiota bacterium]